MGFSFRNTRIVTGQAEVIVPVRRKRMTEEEKVVKKRQQALYIIYIMKNYSPTKRNNQKYNVRVWSKIDQRYSMNVYTNDYAGTLGYVYKSYKIGQCALIDIREMSQRDIEQKFRMRFL